MQLSLSNQLFLISTRLLLLSQMVSKQYIDLKFLLSYNDFRKFSQLIGVFHRTNQFLFLAALLKAITACVDGADVGTICG
jgi:hypothetical protein